jgi:hypothetical protein
MRKQNTENTQNTQEITNHFQTTSEVADFFRTADVGDVALYPKQSDSLESVGIYEDDLLIIRKTKINDENQITLWEHSKEGYHVGFAYDNFGDISINYLLDIERFKAKDMRLIGVVVGIIHCYNAQKPTTIKPTSAEITAVCAECRKEINGTIEFIKKSGWEIEPKQICLACDLFGGAK